MIADGSKRLDYWWTVLVTDPVARPAARTLARSGRVSPDAVTVAALALGLASGPLFAAGTRAGLVAGALVFQLAFVADCIDGKLARALGVTSVRGQALDQLADGGRRASASLGLAVGVWRMQGAPALWWAVAYAILAYYFIEISGAPKGGGPGGIAGRWAGALARRRLLPTPGMPDVQAVVFVLGPVTGLVVPAYALGIAMVAAAILLTVRRRLYRGDTAP